MRRLLYAMVMAAVLALGFTGAASASQRPPRGAECTQADAAGYDRYCRMDTQAGNTWQHYHARSRTLCGPHPLIWTFTGITQTHFC